MVAVRYQTNRTGSVLSNARSSFAVVRVRDLAVGHHQSIVIAEWRSRHLEAFPVAERFLKARWSYADRSEAAGETFDKRLNLAEGQLKQTEWAWAEPFVRDVP